MSLKQKICKEIDRKINKNFIAEALLAGQSDPDGPAPQTINGEIQGFIPALADNLVTQSQFGYGGAFGYDTTLYPVVPTIGPVVNPACGTGDNKTSQIGTLVINPNLPPGSSSNFDLSVVIEDNSAGLGAVILFCPATGQYTAPQGSYSGAVGQTTSILNLDASSLDCPIEDVRVGFLAFGANGNPIYAGNCDEISDEVGTIVVVTPSECLPALNCFEQLFGCSLADLILASGAIDGDGDDDDEQGTEEPQSIVVTREECGVLHAYASTGANGEFGQKCNSSVVRVSEGIYQVTFDQPHPDGPDYPVIFGTLNDGGNRDGTDAEVIDGTQNANGFQYMTMTGDNGGVADVLVDRWTSWAVPAKKSIVTDVKLSSAENVSGCILMEAWDNDSGLLEAGEFSQLEIKIDGVSTGAPIVHDYTTSYDGTNKSTWYDPWVAAINALPNWSITLVQDTSGNQPAQGKPIWQIDYNGPGNEELKLCKGPAGTTSPEELVISAAATGALTGEALTYGGVDAIPSPVFRPCRE